MLTRTLYRCIIKSTAPSPVPRTPQVRQVHPGAVFPDPLRAWEGLLQGDASPGAADAPFTSTASDGPFAHPDVPGLRVARRALLANGSVVVDFFDGTLWMLPLNGQVREVAVEPCA